MDIFNRKIYLLIIMFLIKEIKILSIRIENLFTNFKEFNVLNLFLEKIFPNKHFKIFKINNINKFIDHNKKNIKHNYIKKTSGQEIFVESFINHPMYTIQECIIANTASKILKRNCCGILRQGDIKSTKIFNSFGINKIIYIDQGNFFLRVYTLITAFNLLKNINNIESLIKLKYENIEIGRAVYEQYLRFKKNPRVNSVVLDFYFFLSQALILNDQFKKIFEKNKNTYLVQSETQFYPFRISMANAIKFNVKMISRRGQLANIGLKIYSKKENHLNENRNRPSKKIFALIYKKLNQKKIDKLMSFSTKFFKLNIGTEIHQQIKKRKKLKFFYSKKDVCRYFGFDKKKPIILILAHELSDGTMLNSWNLFNNDLIMLEETIKKIKKIKNVNWIIKSHPSENIYNNKVKTHDIYEKLAKNYENIQLFPNSHDVENFHKFISVAITSHGSAGYEYPLKSIPTIICGETFYSGFGFNIEPKNKSEYFHILKNINTIKKLNNRIIKKCLAFHYLNDYISLERIPISFKNDISMNFDKMQFWKKTYKLTRKYGVFYKSFANSLKFQLLNNYSYYVNLKRFSKILKNY